MEAKDKEKKQSEVDNSPPPGLPRPKFKSNQPAKQGKPNKSK